jgi:hypothetical protein
MAVLRAIEACGVCVEKCACDYCKACVESGWEKPALVHASLCDNCAKLIVGAMNLARIEVLSHFEKEFLHEIERAKQTNATPGSPVTYSPTYIGVFEIAAVKLGAARERLGQGEGYDSVTRLND